MAEEAYFFDFDCTFTRQHTHAASLKNKLKANVWNINESSDEDVANNTKRCAGEAFKRLLAAGNYVAIVTNNDNVKLIKRYLSVAGLTEKEISEIRICHPLVVDGVNPEFKMMEISRLLEKDFASAHLVHYYDDEIRCRNAAVSLKETLLAQRKTLIVHEVSDNPYDGAHFGAICIKKDPLPVAKSRSGFFAVPTETDPLVGNQSEKQSDCLCSCRIF